MLFRSCRIDQGARVTYLGPSGSQIGHKDRLKTLPACLVACMTVFSIAVWSGDCRNTGGIRWRASMERLTNEFHPTQLLADLLTMQEHCPAKHSTK